MERPLVSVIIPVYNVSKYIAACVRSVIEQSYRPIEILLVDDGSKDDSVAIAESVLQESDAAYRVIRQKNSGVSAARNNGILQACGELVIALDADDRLRRNAIETMVSAYENNDVQCVVCNYVVIRDGGEDQEAGCEDTGVSIRTGAQACEKYYKREEIYVSPAMLLSKTFLTENGIIYDEACRFAEDDLYVWHVLSKADHIAYCKEQLYEYIFHANSTMTAATYDRFYSSYHGAKLLEAAVIQKSANAEKIADNFLMRHMLGVTHAAAKVLCFNAFDRFITEVDLPELCKANRKKESRRVRLLLLCLDVSRRLFYNVCRSF